MPGKKSTHPGFDKMTIFPVRKIITMCDAMPEATAVAVGGGRVVGVGSLESLRPWMDRFYYEVDDRLADKVLMPGFIDPHIHPSLPAVLTQFPFLAPEDWLLPTGNFPGATTRQRTWRAYRNWWQRIPTGAFRASSGATIRSGTATNIAHSSTHSFQTSP